MKVIRILALSLAGLIILALIVAAILPPTMVIERSIQINRPVAQVYDNVVDLEKWSAWNPWSKMDPEAEYTLTTPSRGLGATWSWSGQEIGKGSLTTEEILENEKVRFTLKFEEPFPSQAADAWTFSVPEPGTTQVTWSNTTELDYPIGRLSSLFIEPMLEQQFEQGLADLKQVIELEAPRTN